MGKPALKNGVSKGIENIFFGVISFQIISEFIGHLNGLSKITLILLKILIIISPFFVISVANYWNNKYTIGYFIGIIFRLMILESSGHLSFLDIIIHIGAFVFILKLNGFFETKKNSRIVHP